MIVRCPYGLIFTFFLRLVVDCFLLLESDLQSANKPNQKGMMTKYPFGEVCNNLLLYTFALTLYIFFFFKERS